MRVYYDQDADIGLIKGKKWRLLAMDPGACTCSQPER